MYPIKNPPIIHFILGRVKRIEVERIKVELIKVEQIKVEQINVELIKVGLILNVKKRYPTHCFFSPSGCVRVYESLHK